jgi:hypothetical protein
MAPLLPNGSNNNTSNYVGKKVTKNNTSTIVEPLKNNRKTKVLFPVPYRHIVEPPPTPKDVPVLKKSKEVNDRPPHKRFTLMSTFKNKNGKPVSLYRTDRGYKLDAPTIGNYNSTVVRNIGNSLQTNYYKGKNIVGSMAQFKTYLNPDELREKVSKMSHINRAAIDSMIEQFKKTFHDKPEIEEVIKELDRVVENLSKTPTQAELKDAREAILRITHYEKVVGPLLLPMKQAMEVLGKTFVLFLELLESFGSFGIALLTFGSGSTRRKRRIQRHQTRRH